MTAIDFYYKYKMKWILHELIKKQSSEICTCTKANRCTVHLTWSTSWVIEKISMTS